MAITLFVFLFSLAFVTLIGVMFHLKKISSLVFGSLLALLVVFDFALLSLDKIYFLHQEQDHLFTEKLRIYDERIAHQVALQESLTKLQLDISLQVISQNTSQESEASIQQKIIWREQLVKIFTQLDFEAELIDAAKAKINRAVHAYLMEKLNQQLIQGLGHRTYSEFIRSRPRSEWTDELLVSDMQGFLVKHKLQKPDIEFAIKRIQEFSKTGLLLRQSES